LLYNLSIYRLINCIFTITSSSIHAQTKTQPILSFPPTNSPCPYLHETETEHHDLTIMSSHTDQAPNLAPISNLLAGILVCKAETKHIFGCNLLPYNSEVLPAVWKENDFFLSRPFSFKVKL
jgi:hypothetical protein